MAEENPILRGLLDSLGAIDRRLVFIENALRLPAAPSSVAEPITMAVRKRVGGIGSAGGIGDDCGSSGSRHDARGWEREREHERELRRQRRRHNSSSSSRSLSRSRSRSQSQSQTFSDSLNGRLLMVAPTATGGTRYAAYSSPGTTSQTAPAWPTHCYYETVKTIPQKRPVKLEDVSDDGGKMPWKMALAVGDVQRSGVGGEAASWDHFGEEDAEDADIEGGYTEEIPEKSSSCANAKDDLAGSDRAVRQKRQHFSGLASSLHTPALSPLPLSASGPPPPPPAPPLSLSLPAATTMTTTTTTTTTTTSTPLLTLPESLRPTGVQHSRLEALPEGFVVTARASLQEELDSWTIPRGYSMRINGTRSHGRRQKIRMVCFRGGRSRLRGGGSAGNVGGKQGMAEAGGDEADAGDADATDAVDATNTLDTADADALPRRRKATTDRISKKCDCPFRFELVELSPGADRYAVHYTNVDHVHHNHAAADLMLDPRARKLPAALKAEVDQWLQAGTALWSIANIQAELQRRGYGHVLDFDLRNRKRALLHKERLAREGRTGRGGGTAGRK